MTDEALLMLIVDDDSALRVLAAWGALELRLADIDSDDARDRLASIAGVSVGSARASLRKLQAARVLVDGGISDLADRMLQTFVGSRLDLRKHK